MAGQSVVIGFVARSGVLKQCFQKNVSNTLFQRPGFTEKKHLACLSRGTKHQLLISGNCKFCKFSGSFPITRSGSRKNACSARWENKDLCSAPLETLAKKPTAWIPSPVPARTHKQRESKQKHCFPQNISGNLNRNSNFDFFEYFWPKTLNFSN